MASKVLFVDDEMSILESIRLMFRKQPFEVHIAAGAKEGLMALCAGEPFAVVISDFRMPEMDGVAFLEQVRQRSKNTVRMMLTGQADLDTAIRAVNKGHIFRFLSKPCSEPDLLEAVEAGLEYYHLLAAEKELLYGTLRGCIRIMGEVINLLKPEVSSRIQRVAPLASSVAARLNVHPRWEVDIATELCLLGLIFLPDPIINRINKGKLLSTEEFFTFRKCQEVAQELLTNIPRFSGVSNILKYQNKNYDGTGFPEDSLKGEAIPAGARILKCLLDYDWQLQEAKGDTAMALKALEQFPGRMYDPLALMALREVITQDTSRSCAVVDLGDLKEGMVLATDICIGVGKKRMKILREGKVLSDRIIGYLQSINSRVDLPPISIYYTGNKAFLASGRIMEG